MADNSLKKTNSAVLNCLIVCVSICFQLRSAKRRNLQCCLIIKKMIELALHKFNNNLISPLRTEIVKQFTRYFCSNRKTDIHPTSLLGLFLYLGEQ